MKRPALVGIGATALLLLAGTTAFAVWRMPSSRVDLAARAAAMPVGKAPTVRPLPGKLQITWERVTLSGGVDVRYRVNRYAAAHHGAQPAGGCAGTIGGTACAEENVPNGIWTYTVQPVLGSAWTGRESEKSESVIVAAVNVPPKDLAADAASTASPSPSASASASASPSASASAGGASPSPGPSVGASPSRSVATPHGTDVQASNGEGGTAGVIGLGDRLVLSFSGPVDPTTVAHGWDGKAGLPVALKVTGTELSVADADGPLPLGPVTLGADGYAPTPLALAALLSLDGPHLVITVAENQPSPPVPVTKQSQLQWGPVKESGSPKDVDF
ncbi:hypothetical protein Val02_81630 [Virgisporangium aliadipatigenens]|uniref:Uncharacterized protein n=2 Tax=Virgisporangium aliadipatigenens TaxID=741659 RepID=A0A8J3YVJ2_9ACTN|nr:hypothetical protein Val02_81630 [Virgisporangium aliadipatigenens]